MIHPIAVCACAAFLIGACADPGAIARSSNTASADVTTAPLSVWLNDRPLSEEDAARPDLPAVSALHIVHSPTGSADTLRLWSHADTSEAGSARTDRGLLEVTVDGQAHPGDRLLRLTPDSVASIEVAVDVHDGVPRRVIRILTVHGRAGRQSLP